MAEQRTCVNCGQQVGAEQTWICDHCGQLFAGKDAEQRVRQNAEEARQAEEERKRQKAAAGPDATKVERKPIDEDVISVAHGSEETPLDEPLTDVIRPTTEAGGSGREVTAFDKPVEYKAFQGDDMRYGWTLEADADGRYHSVTLHHHKDDSWEVTADEVFEDEERARRWAERKFRESSGVTADT